MRFAYFDESISTRAGFAIGAFVFSDEDLGHSVARALSRNGFTPGVDEFKSSARMQNNQKLHDLRESIQEIVSKSWCKVGVSITPIEPRNKIGPDSLRCLEKIISANNLEDRKIDVYFDEGLFIKAPSQKAARDANSHLNCALHLEQNSKRKGGIQIADLVAGMCMRMLEGELNIDQKLVDVRPHPAEDVPLDYWLWATLRTSFFGISSWKGEFSDVVTFEDKIAFQSVDVTEHGLYISDSCSERLKAAAIKRFGSMYLGCTA